MKKVLFVFTLFMLFGLYACGQRNDGKFNTPIYVVEIIYPDGSSQKTALVSGSNVDWNSLAGKPVFATIATTGSYTDLKNIPPAKTLSEAIQQLGYGFIPGQPTTALSGLVPLIGSGGIVYDITAKCYKLYDPTTLTWSKIVITNQ
jgi:hypothetical protein